MTIPIHILFGNAKYDKVHISPDGKLIAFLANDKINQVGNIFIQPVSALIYSLRSLVIRVDEQQLDSCIQITNETKRSLTTYQWGWSDKNDYYRILYSQDNNGDENFHLHCIEFLYQENNNQPVNNKFKKLYDNDLMEQYTNTTTDYLILKKQFPNHLVFSMNARDPYLFDLYWMDIVTKEIIMIAKNPGTVLQWFVNERLELCAYLEINSNDSSSTLYAKQSFTQFNSFTLVSFKKIAYWEHNDICEFLHVTHEGIYIKTTNYHNGYNIKSDKSTNTARVVLLSLEDGKELKEIGYDPKCDAELVNYHRVTGELDYIVFNYTKPRIEIVNTNQQTDLDYLIYNICKGIFNMESRSDDDLKWIFSDIMDNQSKKYYIYDRITKNIKLLFDSMPELGQYKLATMTPYIINTSDNEEMVVYVSLPVDINFNKNKKGIPFVLNCHGGPWYRDSWGYDPGHQFFTSNGYGCISVNFRGSTGFGKLWLNLSQKQWGGTMQQDLTDAVKWIIAKGFADKEKIAIFGKSYGGYATLAGLAFTPDLFACGIDMVGPSNIQTLIQSIPPYWLVERKMLLIRIGDVLSDNEWNEKISPLFHAHKIKKPLLIIQGANDPRVKRIESDQIATKLFINKQHVEYIIYEDEGHFFIRQENKIDFMLRVKQFLSIHLNNKIINEIENKCFQNSSANVVNIETLIK